ncbi:NAD-dependent epimerase/dehydratase family protein [Bradyrhizobium vignae]|uniref:NAD-dependent epimerase/dehydratase n=1 Tax=Bradyrhizobium vignae TaxID=1549949 RepID=A0A2U3Q9J8_9BRAD|nr:NAD-dependent epimerase/dehydratase family protein [Bradyrhizobium vignae]SPP98121.1 NAD-dependent epimerase/dehydratase [Bradyrhizobium vignae]
MNEANSALVVGGTGPTGPHIVNGLIARGYRVTVFHRGTHESNEIPDSVEHIHGDPHFSQTIQEALGQRDFELVVAMYGRTRLVAQHFGDRAARFVAISALAATRGHFARDALFPTGLPIPASETEPAVQTEADPDGRFAWRIAETEREILALHKHATILRYPIIYGPHQILPVEWCLIRRALDRRPFVILPDGGLQIITRGYSLNMAHAVLCAVDRAQEARGQIFNCGDEHQLSYRQLAEVIASAVGHCWEIVSLPTALATPVWPMANPQSASWHRLYNTDKLKRELGYRDLVPAVEAMTNSVQWYAERRAALAAAIEKELGDPYDYAAEDRLVAEWRQGSQALLARHKREYVERPHPYPHPRTPGLPQDHRGR